ncbi:hypothetical protein F4815DRAFT_455305 [Daldinia loculata]|nr:hypothetical protein F4815DRAFT_455305 [Daldinia loculata]
MPLYVYVYVCSCLCVFLLVRGWLLRPSIQLTASCRHRQPCRLRTQIFARSSPPPEPCLCMSVRLYSLHSMMAQRAERPDIKSDPGPWIVMGTLLNFQKVVIFSWDS